MLGMMIRRLRFPWPPGRNFKRNRSDALAMKHTSIFRLLLTAWRRRMGQHGMVNSTFEARHWYYFGLAQPSSEIQVGIAWSFSPPRAYGRLKTTRPRFKGKRMTRVSRFP